MTILADKATDPFDEIAAAVEAVFRELGPQIQETAKNKLSVPVEVQEGPRGGKIYIRSKPGENPRSQTYLPSGVRLKDDIESEVVSEGLQTTLSISSSKFYAPILQDQMERLVLSDTAEEYDSIVPDRVAAAISGKG